jgi:hypothetical protein
MDDPQKQSSEMGLVVRGQHTKPEERMRVVAAWEASRLSAERFAEQTGIPVSSLLRWRRQRLGVPKLVELPPSPAMMSSEWAAEISTKAGALRLSTSASPTWAAALVREINQC